MVTGWAVICARKVGTRAGSMSPPARCAGRPRWPRKGRASAAGVFLARGRRRPWTPVSLAAPTRSARTALLVSDAGPDRRLVLCAIDVLRARPGTLVTRTAVPAHCVRRGSIRRNPTRRRASIVPQVAGQGTTGRQLARHVNRARQPCPRTGAEHAQPAPRGDTLQRRRRRAHAAQLASSAASAAVRASSAPRAPRQPHSMTRALGARRTRPRAAGSSAAPCARRGSSLMGRGPRAGRVQTARLVSVGTAALLAWPAPSRRPAVP